MYVLVTAKLLQIMILLCYTSTIIQAYKFRAASSFSNTFRRSQRRALSENFTPQLDGPLLNAGGSQPMRAMVFVDGTWLYYSLIEGRPDRMDPVVKLFGRDWNKKYRINWQKLPYLIALNLSSQLKSQYSFRQNVEIVRTSVFTSMRSDTGIGSSRERMLADLYEANFDVHRYETKTTQEKCVDISLAVEMLYLSTVDAFDIAIIVSGDKDFVPALEKVRLLSKKVAICSMRNSCNTDLSRSDARIRDFDMIWLDDYIKELYEMKLDVEGNDVFDSAILSILVKKLMESPEPISSRDVGRFLQSEQLGNGKNQLTQVKSAHGSLKIFLEKYPHYFTVSHDLSQRTSNKEYIISLSPERRSLEYKKQLLETQPQINSYPNDEDPLRNLPFNEIRDNSDVPWEDAENANEKWNTLTNVLAKYSKMSVKDLKAKLKEIGLSTTGNKDLLLERLSQYHSSS